jgi:hypothetical protein
MAVDTWLQPMHTPHSHNRQGLRTCRATNAPAAKKHCMGMTKAVRQSPWARSCSQPNLHLKSPHGCITLLPCWHGATASSWVGDQATSHHLCCPKVVQFGLQDGHARPTQTILQHTACNSHHITGCPTALTGRPAWPDLHCHPLLLPLHQLQQPSFRGRQPHCCLHQRCC